MISSWTFLLEEELFENKVILNFTAVYGNIKIDIGSLIFLFFNLFFKYPLSGYLIYSLVCSSLFPIYSYPSKSTKKSGSKLLLIISFISIS